MEQKEKQLMIFLAGELRNRENLACLIRKHPFDFYAADAGYKTALDMNIHLKYILGDFDSADQPNSSNVIVFPKEKDQTDSELALDFASSEGYKSIWLIAPFGGRMDHTVANLNLLLYARALGVSLKLYDGENLVYLIDEGMCHPSNDFQYYSFFPMGETAVISLDGFKYPLNHSTIRRDRSLCVSNEPKDSKLTVEVHQGSVLCVCIEKEIK